MGLGLWAAEAAVPQDRKKVAKFFLLAHFLRTVDSAVQKIC